MAPSDSRSVNRCGHGHLACKFPINVTVPSKTHASTRNTSASAAHSRVGRDLPHYDVADPCQSKAGESLETWKERIVDHARSAGANDVLKVRADLEPGSDLKHVAGLELSLEISRVIF